MTPRPRIQRDILLDAISENDDLNWDGEITSENVDEAYESVLINNDAHFDYESEFRDSGEETNIGSEFDRNYESRSVARQLTDGGWVGWTFWYGGGKHGEPDAIDWMEDAYEVTVSEREETVTVRTFAKIASPPQ